MDSIRRTMLKTGAAATALAAAPPASRSTRMPWRERHSWFKKDFAEITE